MRFVLVAVHEHGHRDSKHKFLAKGYIPRASTPQLHRPQTFQGSRHQVHRDFRSARGWLEQNSERAHEARYDYVPAVDLLASIFGEAHHKTESRHEDSQEHARFNDIFY